MGKEFDDWEAGWMYNYGEEIIESHFMKKCEEQNVRVFL